MEYMILSRENRESVAQFVASRGGRAAPNEGGGLSVASEPGNPEGDQWRELPLGHCVCVERTKVKADNGEPFSSTRVWVVESPPENEPSDQGFNAQSVADGKTT